MRIVTVALCLLLFFSVLNAIEVLSPVKKDVHEGDVIYLGKIGPGQTLDVNINRKVTTGGIYGEGGLYDLAVITSIPSGWKGAESKFYGDPLQVKVTANKDAAEGDYLINITVVDEHGGEELENITFTGMVTVTWDVLAVDVTPEFIYTSPGKPVRFYITVMNTGTASDTCEVSGSGIKRLEFSKQLYVAAGSSKTITWEVVGEEEERYPLTVAVVSTSSPSIIEYEKNVTVEVVPENVLYDYTATNNGVLIFPVFESLIYSLAGLLSNLW